MKKALSLILALTLCMALAAPAMAADYGKITINVYSGEFIFEAATAEKKTVKTMERTWDEVAGDIALGEVTYENATLITVKPGSTAQGGYSANGYYLDKSGRYCEVEAFVYDLGLELPNVDDWFRQGTLMEGAAEYVSMFKMTDNDENVYFIVLGSDSSASNNTPAPVPTPAPAPTPAAPSYVSAAPLTLPELNGTIKFDEALAAGTVTCNGETLTVYEMKPGKYVYKYDTTNAPILTLYAATVNGDSAKVGNKINTIGGTKGTKSDYWYVGIDSSDIGQYYCVEIEELGNKVRFIVHGVSEYSKIAVKPMVVPTSQKLTVNGVAKNTEIYNIDGSNYFKLRDMAALLNGTGSQFSVDYDAARNTIVVKTGEAYTPVGGELATGTDKSASAVASAQSIEINGVKVELTAFNIGGNNFFKLRELGAALGFDVDYDAGTATMLVTSK